MFVFTKSSMIWIEFIYDKMEFIWIHNNYCSYNKKHHLQLTTFFETSNQISKRQSADNRL